MSLIIPTYEEHMKNDSVRMGIINNIMNIQDLGSLNILSNMAKTYRNMETEDTPMQLNEFVDFLDIDILIKLMEVFKNEPSKYIANRQIKELLKNALNVYIEGDMAIEETA